MYQKKDVKHRAGSEYGQEDDEGMTERSAESMAGDHAVEQGKSDRGMI